jgi:hypothetical protein
MGLIARMRAPLVVIVGSAAVLASLLGIACSGAVRAAGDGGGGGSGGSSGGSGSSSGGSSGSGGSGGGSGSGSSGGGIVGEWQLTGDGGVTQEAFFNADDTCGFIESYGSSSGTESSCVSNYIYSVSGDVLTVEELYDSGFSSAVTADFSISGDTLSLTPADGGFSVVYTRVNAYSSNSCP